MMHDIDQGDSFLRLMAKYCDRYCYFGGSSKSSSQSTSSNTINPAQMQQYQGNYGQASNTANQLTTPFSGQLVSPFTPSQVQAQGILSGIGTNPSYSAPITGAQSAVGGIVNNPFSGSATTGQLGTTDLSPYMNQYQKAVTDASVAQNQYARDQQGVADNASATAANAFGGSRQGVQRAETTGAYDRNDQQNLAALNSANFSQAQNAAESDINNRLASNNQVLNAGGVASNLANSRLAMDTTQAGILGSVGDQQQQQQQAQDTAAYNAFLQQLQQLSIAQQVRNQALGIIPVQQTTNQSGSSSTQTNPGLGGILGSIGSIGLAAAMPGTAGIGGPSSLLGGLFGSAGSAANAGGAASSIPGISTLAMPAIPYRGVFS